MTSLDEALRALEKEYRPSMAADVLHAWAQDVLRLLTTRQEVAPVAWQYRKPGGRWETVSKSTFDKYREGSGYEWRELFASTGQTSPEVAPVAEIVAPRFPLAPGIGGTVDRFVDWTGEMPPVGTRLYTKPPIPQIDGDDAEAARRYIRDWTPDIVQDYVASLTSSTGQTSDAWDAARLTGAEERTQLLFDAKNYWADRSRELEARLVALRDGYRDGSFSDLPGINNSAIAAKLFADELTALLESKP